MRVKLLSVLALVCLQALSPAVNAQAFPQKPIKLIVPFAPGGSTDMVARLLAERMSPILGQSVVVENRAGVGGVLGADAVAKASPDGYTLLMGTVSTHGASPAVYKKIPYDAAKDFEPITNVMSVPSVLTVHPKLPVKNLQEFVALAKASPGKYSYGSPGNGSLGHANVENLLQLAGIKLLHVPYKGGGPALNDALAGQIDALTDNLPSTLPHIQAGRLRPLALLSPQRSKLLPDLPTYKESGYPDLDEGGWFGLLAPAKTPRAVVLRLNEAAHQAMQDPAFKARAETIDGIAMANTPEQFGDQIKRALARYQRIAKSANIQID
jgi:tripartite-type tricarboxylate transporter receptor subunit TctC